jgi:glycosyltransferase involved in cell wall biosynthesis
MGLRVHRYILCGFEPYCATPCIDNRIAPLQAFQKSGVLSERIFVIPEAVDPTFFRPLRDGTKPLYPKQPGEFVFLSVFKFEERKNWRGLLDAFVHEFHSNLSNPEPVSLRIFTKPYAGAMPGWEVTAHLRQKHRRLNVTQLLERITIVSDSVSANTMPRIFASADAFVLPSRGEGWGLPLMEAMAMELPTIGTAFGGNLDFMNPDNSYLVNVSVPDASASACAPGYARPYMRLVVTGREEPRDLCATVLASVCPCVCVCVRTRARTFVGGGGGGGGGGGAFRSKGVWSGR